MVATRLCYLLGILVLAGGVSLASGCGAIRKDDPGDDGDDGSTDDDDAPDDAGDDGDAADDGDGGDDGVPAETAVCVGASGSRIRRIMRQHDDGTSEAIGMRDTELGGNCRFGPDREGALRCLPVTDNRPFGFASRYFTDAGCTNPIAYFGSVANVTPGYAVFFESGTCGTVFRYHELGAQQSFPARTPLFFRTNPGGQCAQTTASTSPDVKYFALGAEMALDRFVAAGESTQTDGRLAVRVIEGEDGSRVCDRDTGFVDTGLGGHPCREEESDGGVRRCLPLPNSLVRVTNDSICRDMRDAVQVFATCDRGLEYTQKAAPVSGACRVPYKVHDMAEELAGPFYYDDFDGCLSVPSDRLHFALGPEVAATSFAELREERVDLGMRLERVDVVGDGVRMQRPSWFDGELDVSCEFRPGGDGAQRCIPGTTLVPEAQIVSFYVDPLCEGATVDHAVFNDACGGGREPKYAVRSNSGGARVFAIGQAFTEPRYQWNGGCSLPPATARLFTIGPEVPPDSFVAGSELVEP
jgi:hypothetical protein